MIDKIVDVASVDGHIDWSKVKGWGCRGAMLRATGGIDVIDPEYNYNASECLRFGIPFGSYGFIRPWMPVLEQVELFLDLRSPGVLPDACDLELSRLESRMELTGRTYLWLRQLAVHTGKRPLLYSNIAYLTGKILLPKLVMSVADLWLSWPSAAQQPAGVIGYPNPILWQYTWKEKVPGVPGACDVNRWYGPEF